MFTYRPYATDAFADKGITFAVASAPGDIQVVAFDGEQIVARASHSAITFDLVRKYLATKGR